MALALTNSKLYYREKYEPLPSSIFTVPYPYTYWSKGKTPDEVVDESLEHFNVLFNQFIHPDQVASIIVEPVQGEGGYIVPPSSFLPKLRKIADKYGILLIIDEVQTGFGRTGAMFACEHSKVEPDIMLMAKGIAGGMPLSGFISRKDITKHWPAGRHGSTFGGNPVSCAAALATIQVIEQEKLCDRAKKSGERMLARLSKLTSNPLVGEVRGLGLMIGLEFIDGNGRPNHDLSEKVAAKCFENKMIVLTCGSHGHVIRLIPALNTSDAEADEGMSILENAINAAS